jgi:hypothetical protein
VNFIGPSYTLRQRSTDVQRVVNMYPVPIESGNTKSPWAFKDVPGLTLFCALGAEVRGAKNVLGRVFFVAGSNLYEVSSSGVATNRGTLSTSSGPVDMASNTTQLAVSDESSLYVLTLASNTFTTVADYPGGGRFMYLNQYGLFRHRDSGRFGWTALADFTSLDDLDFATAERSPDNLVCVFVDHGEVILFGTESTEIWSNTGSDSVFERNQGAHIETGCAAEYTVQKMDGSVYWLASDDKGQGQVMRLQGYQPAVVSTEAITQKLQGIDLSEASAFTYQQDKSFFYVLNVPSLDTTWVYDSFTSQWHERAELTNGDYERWRARVHCYAFQKHLVGDEDGNVYELDPDVHNNDGDPLVRSRVTPDSQVPGRGRVHYGAFHLDCDRGEGGSVMLRNSNDGGRSWGNWQIRSMGETGDYGIRVKWERQGSAKDRVVEVRVTDDVPFNPVAGGYV